MENSTTFKTRVVETPVSETPVKDTPGLIQGETDLPKAAEATDRLDVWESENKRDYFQDLFNIRETAHVFPVKAQYKYIDKFVKAELADRNWDTTITNYKALLAEFENEIGSAKMETYSRMQRLFNYIKTLHKYREIKAKKEAFKTMLG